MVLYIIITFAVGILVGRAWRDFNIEKACKDRTVLNIEGRLYGVHEVKPEV